MARETFESWIPVELGSAPIQALARESAVERWARPEPMASDTKQVPRSGDFAIAAVAKGTAYSETAGTNDYVELIARKAGGVARVAEEDLLDTSIDILATKQVDAARNLAKFLDNAALGTTAAANGTTVLYTSVYRAVTQADAAVGYTANANLVQTAGAVDYADLSGVLAKVEESEWADNLVVIAHPSFRTAFRDILGTDDRPVFADATSGADPTLFGYPIHWSQGAKTSAVSTSAPTGNPLLVVANRDLLIKGVAKLSPGIASTNPGFSLQRANTGVGFLTDEALLKVAVRRGFAVGTPLGVAVLEKTAA